MNYNILTVYLCIYFLLLYLFNNLIILLCVVCSLQDDWQNEGVRVRNRFRVKAPQVSMEKELHEVHSPGERKEDYSSRHGTDSKWDNSPGFHQAVCDAVFMGMWSANEKQAPTIHLRQGRFHTNTT